MLYYNTRLKKLPLPEYGRNIQRMVDHCLTLEDREQRNACAYAIVETMEHLFPADGNQEEYHRKLWDHLAIMSDFKLDIDWPFEVIKAEALATEPQPIKNEPFDIQHRQYGKNLEAMVDVASKLAPSEERDALVMLLANQMKKMMLADNPDGVEDAKVFKDLRQLSHGAFNLNPDEVHLHEFKAMPVPKKKKKK